MNVIDLHRLRMAQPWPAWLEERFAQILGPTLIEVDSVDEQRE